MNRIMPPIITFQYVNASDSPKRLQMAYNRIFEIARKNLIKRKQMETKGVVFLQDSNN